MVFSSLIFIYLFLPFCVAGYYFFLHKKKDRVAIAFLFLMSLFYYGYWKPANIWIIIVSILFNYQMGKWILQKTSYKKIIFYCGIAGNILALGYYKYTDFTISTINAIAQTNFTLHHIILPIGISFFTFQQIAYLVDIYTNKYINNNEHFLDYCCFVCFFPQLVAGPIVHHAEMMPQFADSANKQVNWENMYNGLVLFSIGLAKKVLVADNLSPIVGYCFDQVDTLTFLEACTGSICYTLQLYYDFSGYSDMAVGCGLFFNIKLPFNFNSPYQACNIQDFWRRWHITLSRWLQAYLYIPLGGNRQGTARTCGNLLITFLLAGLWHGAAWTFVLWGGLHGLALVFHRLWSQVWKKKMPAFLGWVCTFAFVNLAWVVFRVPNFDRLGKFCDAFLGQNGWMWSVTFRTQIASSTAFPTFAHVGLFILCILLITIYQNNIKIDKIFLFIILNIIMIQLVKFIFFSGTLSYLPILILIFILCTNSYTFFRKYIHFPLTIIIINLICFAFMIYTKTNSEFLYFQF